MTTEPTQSVCETCGGKGTVLAELHYPAGEPWPLTCLRCAGTGRVPVDGYVPMPCACGAVTLAYASATFVEDNTVHRCDKCEAHGD